MLGAFEPGVPQKGKFTEILAKVRRAESERPRRELEALYTYVQLNAASESRASAAVVAD